MLPLRVEALEATLLLEPVLEIRNRVQTLGELQIYLVLAAAVVLELVQTGPVLWVVEALEGLIPVVLGVPEPLATPAIPVEVEVLALLATPVLLVTPEPEQHQETLETPEVQVRQQRIIALA
jgi:hypothetical protein